MTSVHATNGGPPPLRRATVTLGVGSNLGDRREHLRRGFAWLRQHLQVQAVSGLYETAPVGVTDQPAFLNAVVVATTAAEPRQVLRWAQGAEAAERRVRSVRWGPRTLDVDVLLFGDRVVQEPDLVIPHPRMHERAFVLAPLAEVAPDWVHPLLGVAVTELLALVDLGGVSRVEGPAWALP